MAVLASAYRWAKSTKKVDEEAPAGLFDLRAWSHARKSKISAMGKIAVTFRNVHDSARLFLDSA